MYKSKFEYASIREFFDGRSILITGATGFMGASLIQRLLTTTTIKTIYVLIREKGHLTMAQRANRFMKCSTFKTMSPNAIKKIVPVKGDVTHRNLGLSHSDRQKLLADVTIVFNCAASVDWEGLISDAIKQNVFATKNVIGFCEQFRHRAVLVHTSTIAAWSNHEVLEECVPISESWTKYEQLLNEATTNKESASQLTNDVIGDHPKHCNTYGFSKSMAELVVKTFLVNKPNSNLQIVTARLPAVCGALREPSPGHVLTFQTSTVLNCFAALGLIQILNEFRTDDAYRCVPVDMCSNALIAISYAVGMRLVTDDVINVFPKLDEAPLFKDFAQFAADIGNDYPSLTQMAPPFPVSKFTFVNSIRGRLDQIKMKYLESRIGKKMDSVRETLDMSRRASNAMTRFAVIENLDKVLSHLSKEERELFYYEFRDIDWKENVRETFLQFRRQQLGEGDDNLTLARRRFAKIKMLWRAVDYFIMLFILLIVVLVANGI